MTSSNPNPSTTTPPETEDPLNKSGGGNVADYFAILGVGETLVWKHTQKTFEEQPNEQEEEAALLERFYREIVQVSIVASVKESSSSQHSKDGLVLSPSLSVDSSVAPPSVATSTPPVSTAANHLTVLEQTCETTNLNNESGNTRSSRVTWEANLDVQQGLQSQVVAASLNSTLYSSGSDKQNAGTPLKGLKTKLRQPMQHLLKNKSFRGSTGNAPSNVTRCFHLAYGRRGPEETDNPAISHVSLQYVRLHKSTVKEPHAQVPLDPSSTSTPTKSASRGATGLARVAKQTLLTAYRSHSSSSPLPSSPLPSSLTATHTKTFLLQDLLELPPAYDEWSIPDDYQQLYWGGIGTQNVSRTDEDAEDPVTMMRRKTVVSPHEFESHGESEAVEAYVASPRAIQEDYDKTEEENLSVPTSSSGAGLEQQQQDVSTDIPTKYLPKLMPMHSNLLLEDTNDEEDEYIFIPVLAVRRQRVGDEERYHEDVAIVDLAVSVCDSRGAPVIPEIIEEDFDIMQEPPDEAGGALVAMSRWCEGQAVSPSQRRPLGTPVLVVRRNHPIGFCDAAFATSVLDRFPMKNYKEFPLPEEELPMFCYPTGCRLHRARFSDAPLPQYYGFVVKNERGDSIHVSCVSFMEPLTSAKTEQLKRMSEQRQRTSLPNRRYCEKRGKRRKPQRKQTSGSSVSDLPSASDTAEGVPSEASTDDATEDDSFLTAFSDMTTFENKTICLIGRYPFWTAFRRFLSHLHIISGSSSDLPLERFISHLLLTVPVPKAGGPSVIVPLPALNGPMELSMPPNKDFPLLDLPFQRIFACLDVATVVTVVLGFLALERKILIMSSRPSLVLDACELLRSLLFPFELAAPYVPRLTQPFMSCLEFPGAIFAGIHDDGTPDGLASSVKKNPPEDSIIVNLDTGEIDCSGDRYEVLKQCWGVIPSGPRSMLVSEVETLCRDAGIVPGQEPLDSQVDSAFAASLPTAFVEGTDSQGLDVHEPLDDRAIRDAFLRFFCAVLGGYERYLVVPDADFLVSGNEWFDSQAFLSSAPQDRAPYLGSLVTTQLFQSFIQRRTEASDVHCLLFDECIIEYHSSPVPYGRLGGDVENVATSEGGQPQMLYSLLVDQCSAETYQSIIEGSRVETDRSMLENIANNESTGDVSGLSIAAKSTLSTESHMSQRLGSDIVTVPSRQNLAEASRFVYFVDGNPCFPHRLNPDLFFPLEPKSLLAEISETPPPLLARTERELEEAHRRRKSATSHRGLQSQRRCLWQLPKLMGSHVLGAWLMCIPSQVSQPGLSQEQQSRYLLRALGALRLIRSKQRLVPDEAAYRSLMVACGRIGSDRRIELVKLFGLLRQDGIFPSAVTLGQYTKALAEGYSKRSIGMTDDEFGGVEVTVSGSYEGRFSLSPKSDANCESFLNVFDGNLAVLEDSGRRWRQRQSKESGTSQYGYQSAGNLQGEDFQKKQTTKPWIPVFTSSSFVPFQSELKGTDPLKLENVKFVALWSRTRACDNCSYILLDEEVQSGWDVVGGQDDPDCAVPCPRCGSLLVPMIGYKELELNEAAEPPPKIRPGTETLPPQLGNALEHAYDYGLQGKGFVRYMSPSAVRLSLERYVEAEGDSVLLRETLRQRDPELFYNFWWYCARFSLPLPLPTVAGGSGDDLSKSMGHVCACAAYEKSVALRGCYEGAQALLPHLDVTGGNPENGPCVDFPLLSRFNMQAFSQGDWDHDDLSKILVTLVEACDKRDFKPVVECVLRCNQRRIQKNTSPESDPGDNSMIEATLSDLTTDTATPDLDCYRTILYLAKYQCTSAFHVFFPATVKPCKGYHFWCATGTPLPVFDHMFRDAVKRIRNRDNTFTPLNDVSDVALGFRCVFGHII